MSGLLDIERASLGRLLDRLAQKGWVERRADDNDRRIKRVFLTGEVEPLMQTMRAVAAETRADSLAGLSQAEQEQLIEFLLQIKGNLLRSNGENGRHLKLAGGGA